MTIEEVFEKIKKQNLNLERLSVEQKLQEINLFQSKGARIPTLSANANQNYNFGRSIDPFSNQFVQQEIRANNFNLVGSLELFNGFRVSRQISQQEQNVKASEEAVKRTKNEQLLNAYSIFLQGLMSQEQLRLSQKQIENLGLQKTRATIRIENGVENLDILSQINVNIANANLNLVLAKGQLANAKLQIIMAMQEPLDTNFRFADPLNIKIQDTLMLLSLDSEKSASSLPQTKEAEYRIRAAYYAYKVSQSGFYPRLVFNAGMATVFSNQNRQITGSPTINNQFTGFVNNDPNFPVFLAVPSYRRETVPFFQQIDRNWSQFLQFQLNIPILTSRLNKSNLMRSKMNQDLAQSTAEMVKNQTILEIEQAKINYQNAWERFKVQSKRLEEQKKLLELVNARYENGTATVFEVGNIQNQVNQIEIEKTQAEYEWIFRFKVLEFYQNNSLFE
ncbi:MAG: TolC family protein [Cytophagales bacterium]